MIINTQTPFKIETKLLSQEALMSTQIKAL